jgi:hypothetical protein
MISKVTFWVEHGEDTEPFEDMIEAISGSYASGDITMIASDFTVDVEAPILKWFINEEGNVYDYLPDHQAEHFPNDFHRPFDTEQEAAAAAEEYDRIMDVLRPVGSF